VSIEVRSLLPESIDDYVSDTNPVRIVDFFVDEPNLIQLGFEGAFPAYIGRPAYHPSILLKIYIYGYLKRIQSSRRLERKAQRNIGLMWPTGHLMPDFKTTASFLQDNSKAIRGVCRQFVVLFQHSMLRINKIARPRMPTLHDWAKELPS
jgi:transposase